MQLVDISLQLSVRREWKIVECREMYNEQNNSERHDSESDSVSLTDSDFRIQTRLALWISLRGHNVVLIEWSGGAGGVDVGSGVPERVPERVDLPAYVGGIAVKPAEQVKICEIVAQYSNNINI